ncbi:MAG TPA: Gfo/Idh/MocA family oxidoreductase [Candidatus Binataceae bacterium]|nr:Gfo/Idh/MocA family oxidoreductase [Candidatus Binataceae bacterium]
MIRIAISGTGAIAERAHIPALLGIPDFRIVALQSRTIERARRTASAMWPDTAARPAVYADFAAMLAGEAPDAVVILTPNHLHYEYTVAALAAGAHVLCEKPMAPNPADARRMVDTARGAGRVLMVAMQRRYGALEAAVKRALDSGAIGTPHFIRARLSHGGPHEWAPGQAWFTTPGQAGGGAMLDLGVHIADLAIWYLGAVEAVDGQLATLGKPLEVEDTGVAILRFSSGALGVLEASWSSTPGLSALEIYGAEGRVMIGYPRNDVSILRADGAEAPGFTRAEIMAAFDPRDLLAPFRALAANFAAAIAGRAAPHPDGADGLRAVEVIDACYRSARTGARVRMSLG